MRPFHYNGIEIETVKEYKYLGIIFSNDGFFTTAQENLYRKGLKAYYKICGTIDLEYNSASILTHLFGHMLKPTLLYEAEIWDLTKIDIWDPVFHTYLTQHQSKYIKRLTLNYAGIYWASTTNQPCWRSMVR